MLIPPRGKLLITPPPSPTPTPPDESNLLSARGQDEGEGLLRLIGEKNVKGETEKRPWQQLRPRPSMRRPRPRRVDKLAGGAPFVAIHPPTSLEHAADMRHVDNFVLLSEEAEWHTLVF